MTVVIGPARSSGIVLISLAMLAAGCAGEPAGDPARGEQLYRQQTIGASEAPGCITCHSLDPGVVKVGPSHSDVAQRAAQVIASGDYKGEANSPADYLRESILTPNAYVVEGFQPGVMYARYAEVLSDQQVEDLVAFLLTQGER